MVATAEDKALAETLRQWQLVEDKIVEKTDEVLDKVKSPLVRVMMELIQHDSRLHRHMQQIIIDSLEKKAIDVPEEEVEDLWNLLDQHRELERRSIELAESSLEAIGGEKRHEPDHYLISYLLDDEKKHEKILASLAMLKSRMYES
jgi:hypothetical protein